MTKNKRIMSKLPFDKDDGEERRMPEAPKDATLNPPKMWLPSKMLALQC